MSSLKQTNSPAIVLASPSSPQAEGVRALRTHLVVQHLQLGRRAIAVCAVTPGVGSSFISTNLAIAFSQIGTKTLLVDANMRDPAIAKFLPNDGDGRGLKQCLESRDEPFGSYINDNVLPSLSALYAGGTTSSSQELLGGNRFNQLMDFCLREYDLTIVDTPPANSCSDSRRVSSVVGYALVVAAKDVSRLNDIKILGEQMTTDHVTVIGTVLNQA